jgi:hypothetical protein
LSAFWRVIGAKPPLCTSSRATRSLIAVHAVRQPLRKGVLQR